jgi:hypothetical protein
VGTLGRFATEIEVVGALKGAQRVTAEVCVVTCGGTEENKSEKTLFSPKKHSRPQKRTCCSDMDGSLGVARLWSAGSASSLWERGENGQNEAKVAWWRRKRGGRVCQDKRLQGCKLVGVESSGGVQGIPARPGLQSPV